MNKLDELCKAHLSKETIPKCDSNNEETTLLPRSLTHFATGLVRVAKDDLMSTIDFGVPPNPDTKGLDALIVYNVKDALPSGISNANSPEIPLLTATNATENCDTLNVVLTNNPGPTRQCLALVGSQYQSYHVQRYMRRDKHHSGLNSKFPLELTSRGLTRNGKVEFPPPSPTDVLDHQESLRTYLNNADGIRKKLKETIDGMGVKTVVVLTCNHGQSELLMNFVCSSRSRGFDLKNVLVFPTDIETKELAEGMGLTTFYEETIMASIPKGEAKFYGDIIFRKVMFAKVLCVQLVNELSHDLLFMDVDIVWYKDPLLYFENKTLPDFDIYFQDDGSRQERYAPYSANSGFYYVRQNERTKHLFRHLLYSGDLINAWYSHQQVLIALLAEYNSLLGLSVKILAKEMEEFPGGVQYHRKNEAMKKIMRRDSNAIIFHMSWTTNKDNKLKFFQQMGEWHVQDKCIGKRFDEITNEPVGTKVIDEKQDKDSYRSSEDSDFDEEESDDVSVDLSEFEEEDKKELQALKEEAEEDMASTKRSNSRKQSPKKASVDDVTERLKKASIGSSADFSSKYIFPWSRHRVKDGLKDIVHVEFQAMNLPTTYLRLAKVLPGGTKFATCTAAPKWFF
ncbi:hypothetical protein HJC23_011148 [Cyclotella cryptica]|uniref:Nucleotide-diphospho-sugar transferase domain-containing protein n=1 Tax=Cyclotella cryptica TaxID=29204 RepID=A0ABD3NVX9_9STRA